MAEIKGMIGALARTLGEPAKVAEKGQSNHQQNT
jgi:hypothetical protein